MKCLKIIELTFYMCLLGGSLYFMWDVFKKYKSRDTSLKQYQEHLQEYPTIIMCFKTSKMLEYDMDFNISIILPNLTYLKLDIGANHTQYDGDVLKLEKFLTPSTGICYKITKSTSAPFINQTYFSMEIFFNNSLSKNDLPTTKFFITTERNSYGIANFQWIEGEVLTYDVKPETMTEVNLKIEKNILLRSETDCTESSMYQCIVSKCIKTFKCEQWEDGCIPRNFYESLRPFFDEETLICKHEIDQSSNCSKQLMFDSLQNNGCKNPCSTTEFIGKVSFEGEIENIPLTHRSWFVYHIKAPAMIAVQKQYLIYDFEGLVGSVGGTLGMFIGFSFINIITHVLAFFQHQLENKDE